MSKTLIHKQIKTEGTIQTSLIQSISTIMSIPILEIQISSNKKTATATRLTQQPST